MILCTLAFIPLGIAVSIGNNDVNGVIITPSASTPINYSLVNTNNSLYWQGHTGTDGSWLNISGAETDPIWSFNSNLVPYLANNNTFTGNLNTFNNIISNQTVNQNTTPSITVIQNAELLEDQSSKTGTTSNTLNTVQWVASKFIPTSNFTAGVLIIRLKRSGTITNPTQYVTLRVYSDDGGSPSKPLSNLQQERTIPYGALTTAYQEFPIMMNGGGYFYRFYTNTTYWLVLQKSILEQGGGYVQIDTDGVANMGANSSNGVTWYNIPGQWYVKVKGQTYYAIYADSVTTPAIFAHSTGSNAIQLSSDFGNPLYSTCTTCTAAIQSVNTYGWGSTATSTSNNGAVGTSTSGAGLQGISTSGAGLSIFSTTGLGAGIATQGIPLQLQTYPTTSGIQEATRNYRQMTTNPPTNGISWGNYYWIQDDTGTEDSAEFNVGLSNITRAKKESFFVFRTMYDRVFNNILRLNGKNASINGSLSVSDNISASIYLFNNGQSSITDDGLNLIFNTNLSRVFNSTQGLAWFSNNISATGYITRTEVYDKNRGDALDMIKDSSLLKNIDGSINHSAFGDCYTRYPVVKQNGSIKEDYQVCEPIIGEVDMKIATEQIIADIFTNETQSENYYTFFDGELKLASKIEMKRIKSNITILKEGYTFNETTGKFYGKISETCTTLTRDIPIYVTVMEDGVNVVCEQAKHEQALSEYHSASDVWDMENLSTPILSAPQGIATSELYMMSKGYKTTKNDSDVLKSLTKNHYKLDGTINYSSYGELYIKDKIKIKSSNGSITLQDKDFIDILSYIGKLEYSQKALMDELCDKDKNKWSWC